MKIRARSLNKLTISPTCPLSPFSPGRPGMPFENTMRIRRLEEEELQVHSIYSEETISIICTLNAVQVLLVIQLVLESP